MAFSQLEKNQKFKFDGFVFEKTSTTHAKAPNGKVVPFNEDAPVEL